MTSRIKHPEVTAIHTQALSVTAQPGQWFCLTPKCWELWDRFAGKQIKVRRILICDVLNVEKKFTPPQFEREVDVTLQHIDTPNKMRGKVISSNPLGTIIYVNVQRPPAWFLQLLQQRGLFTNGPQDLQLFYDHTGNWTDIFGFNHFKIT